MCFLRQFSETTKRAGEVETGYVEVRGVEMEEEEEEELEKKGARVVGGRRGEGVDGAVSNCAIDCLRLPSSGGESLTKLRGPSF